MYKNAKVKNLIVLKIALKKRERERKEGKRESNKNRLRRG